MIKWCLLYVTFSLVSVIVLTSSLQIAQISPVWSETRDISERTDIPFWGPVILCDQYQNLHEFWYDNFEMEPPFTIQMILMAIGLIHQIRSSLIILLGTGV